MSEWVAVATLICLMGCAGAAGWAVILGTSAGVATLGGIAIALGYGSMLLIVEHPDARPQDFINYLTWVTLAGALPFGLGLSLAGLRRDAADPVAKFVKRYVLGRK